MEYYLEIWPRKVDRENTTTFSITSFSHTLDSKAYCKLLESQMLLLPNSKNSPFWGNPLSHGPNVNRPLMPHQTHKKKQSKAWSIWVKLGNLGDDSGSCLRLIHKSQTPADSILCKKGNRLWDSSRAYKLLIKLTCFPTLRALATTP